MPYIPIVDSHYDFLSFNSRQIVFSISAKKSTNKSILSSAVHKADPDDEWNLLKSTLAVGFEEKANVCAQTF